MNVDVDVKSNLAAFQNALQQQIKIGLRTVGDKAETHAKELCPVVTGRLKNSISHAEDEDSTYIGTNVEYAPAVELGTRNHHAQHFLRDAAVNYADEYAAIIEAALK